MVLLEMRATARNGLEEKYLHLCNDVYHTMWVLFKMHLVMFLI